ncbi:7-methylguanosine phosphate-specific 5'-nucleotidase-like [Nymphalis io]|uniref:7-methylguanosine phosphate-specific 5'-nucleotidase-like n=1 Tax=Inachis io TaxID=171585 RepID=UPI002168FC94|nr:7-methylguanosine phosphate-specific 5'-nucleotidase-like [Nymphalis io]
MNMFANLCEIPELSRPNVFIKDKEDLLKKINLIVSEGNKKLQIVTDFDHTLTRHNMDNGDPVLTSYGMFRECPSIPKHYKDEENRLSEIYKPIEVDPVMSDEDKTKHMIDWYVAGHKLLKGMQFPKNELEEVSQKMKECFRIGVNELLAWSEAKQVPVLVFSAGLGECVVAALRAANLLLPHVKVVSNFLAFDDAGAIIGIKGDVIHTYNKNETVIKNTEYYEMVKERNNVLLMGDNIGDASMAEGMEHCDVIIKIGFLGRNTDANLQNYVNKFDIVLVNDHTMDIANAILKHVL